MPSPSTVAAFRDADIPAMLADTGVAINIGATKDSDGVDGVGLLDEADQILVQDANRGQVIELVTTLTVQTSAFPNMAIGDAVSVAGKSFTIRERLREGDGGLTKLLLGV